jgi:hypothetical protein
MPAAFWLSGLVLLLITATGGVGVATLRARMAP